MNIAYHSPRFNCRSLSKLSCIEIILHIFAWLFVFLLPQAVGFNETGRRHLMHFLLMLGGPLSMGFTFYANYLWLIPKYYTQAWGTTALKKRLSFVQWNILLITFSLTFHLCWIAFLPKFFPSDELFSHCLVLETITNTSSAQFFMFVRSLIMLLLSMGLAIFIRLGKTTHKAQEERIRAEKKLILSQISPHFLLNTLNNIYALVQIDTQRAREHIHRLSKLLSYVLYETQLETTTLQQEANFIIQYIELIKLRVGPNVTINYHIHLTDMGEAKIPPMLLHPLIENGFKHGITNEAPCHISLNLSAKANVIRLEIRNSNNPKAQNERHVEGLGIHLTKQRLEAQFAKNYLLNMQVTPDGKEYHTRLIIRLESRQKN